MIANDDAAQLGEARNASDGLVQRSATQLLAVTRGSSEGGEAFMARRIVYQVSNRGAGTPAHEPSWK